MREGKPQPFIRGPVFEIEGDGRREEYERFRYPKVKIADNIAFVSIRLAHAGYYSGDPQKVREAPVDVVQSILDYEDFRNNYEKKFIELNKQK